MIRFSALKTVCLALAVASDLRRGVFKKGSVFSVLKRMSPGQVLVDPHILFISVFVF